MRLFENHYGINFEIIQIVLCSIKPDLDRKIILLVFGLI